MTALRRRRSCAVLAALLLVPLAGYATPPAGEQEMIDRLIDRVGTMKDARFVRNFREYDAATAAQFLREKYKSMGGGVKTCDEFIDRIASRSSLTGLAYKIRFADGREMPASEFLRGELGRLRAPG